MIIVYRNRFFVNVKKCTNPAHIQQIPIIDKRTIKFPTNIIDSFTNIVNNKQSVIKTLNN